MGRCTHVGCSLGDLIVCLHPPMSRLLQPFLINGGPAGAFAAFPFVIFGVLMQVCVMAEMASMYASQPVLGM